MNNTAISPSKNLYRRLMFGMAAFLLCADISLCKSPEMEGPYIDSLGYLAAQNRLHAVEEQSAESLFNQALQAKKGRADDSEAQPEFFRSLEENYQRYRMLFSLHRKGPVPSAYCPYDLMQTFAAGMFDAQPFMNAILHTLRMTDITTLSFAVRRQEDDRMIVRVSWAKAVSRKGSKGFSISEGSLDLLVTSHWIAAIPVR
jgi:hypothetical protein